MRIGITGISGSLGTALVQALTEREQNVVVGVTRDELKAEKVMAGRENVRCMVVASGLDDEVALRRAFDGCQFIIHAAALKRISGSVYAAHEMVKTNIVGTQTILRVARDLGVKKVVVVSSDKAVEATNLYGSSKFCAECVAIQENAFSYPKGTSVCVVRYGNVLGSRGSVVHIWREQIRQRKPVTLTDAKMTRFIITLNQAVNVIGDAIAYGRAGDILVPKLKAALMTDLLQAVQDQECPGQEIEVRQTGLRPGGEKLHESLLSREEIPRTYEDANYWIVPPSHASWAKPLPKLGLAFFGSTEYSSDTVPLHSVPELAALLQDVPDRAPND